MTTKDLPTTAEPDVEELPRRLCSEIQLFDLCELERCSFKDGRYCTHADLLARFEAVAEPEDRPAQQPDDEDDEEDGPYPVEREDDDDDYSVFDDEDELDEASPDKW